MLALQIILTRIFSIHGPSFNISFAFFPMMIVGLLYGGRTTTVFAIMADLLGSFFFPFSRYFIGYTLVAAIRGAIIGYGLYGHPIHWKRGLFVVLSSLIICTLILNSLMIAIVTGVPFWAMMISRIPQTIILAVTNMIILMLTKQTHLVERMHQLGQGKIGR